MKNKRLFWGIIMLFFGIIALLSTLGIFEFSWLTARKLWPFILIIIGILILPVNDNIKTTLVVLTLGLCCLTYHFEAQKEHSFLDLFSSADIGQQKKDTNENTYTLPVNQNGLF